MRRTFLCVLLLLFVTVGCTDPKSSNITEPLRPLWVVNTDQNLQSIRVSGRVLEQQSSDFYLGAAFEALVRGQVEATWIIDEEQSQIVGINAPIRLVDRDQMRAVDSRGSYRLYRREQPFNYRTAFPYRDDVDEVELRLEYREQRFDPSVTTARFVDLNNVVLAESDSVLSATDNINLSWNLGDMNLPASSALIQRIRVLREGCDTSAEGETELMVLVAADARANSIPVNDFPAPSSNLSGTCTYSVQVMAAEIPTSLLIENADINAPQDAVRSLEPVTVILTLSELRRVQVMHGN